MRPLLAPCWPDGRPATVQELASAAGLTPDEAAALRAINHVEWDAEGRVSG